MGGRMLIEDMRGRRKTYQMKFAEEVYSRVEKVSSRLVKSVALVLVYRGLVTENHMN